VPGIRGYELASVTFVCLAEQANCVKAEKVVLAILDQRSLAVAKQLLERVLGGEACRAEETHRLLREFVHRFGRVDLGCNAANGVRSVMTKVVRNGPSHQSARCL
jgi:hypothetical protein